MPIVIDQLKSLYTLEEVRPLSIDPCYAIPWGPNYAMIIMHINPQSELCDDIGDLAWVEIMQFIRDAFPEDDIKIRRYSGTGEIEVHRDLNHGV